MMRRVQREIVGIALGLLMFGGVLALYQWAFPVTAFMSGLPVERNRTDVTLRVTGYKIRDCKLVSGSFVGWYINENGEWQEASGAVEFPKDASPENSRPSSWFSKQNFGLFKLNGISPQTELVRVTLRHICDGDDVVTLAGDETMPEEFKKIVVGGRLTINGPWKIPPFEVIAEAGAARG